MERLKGVEIPRGGSQEETSLESGGGILLEGVRRRERASQGTVYSFREQQGAENSSREEIRVVPSSYFP